MKLRRWTGGWFLSQKDGPGPACGEPERRIRAKQDCKKRNPREENLTLDLAATEKGSIHQAEEESREPGNPYYGPINSG